MGKQKQDRGALPFDLPGGQAGEDATPPAGETAQGLASGINQDAPAEDEGSELEGQQPEQASGDNAGPEGQGGGGTSVDSGGRDDAADASGDAGSPQKVLALVLLDCHYGKCGEVKEFDVVQANALRVGGYIDTHPNAVAWAKG